MGIFDRFNLTGKRLFITGGSRGLGREMALAIADAGADVILVGREPTSLETTAGDIRALGRQSWAIAADWARHRITGNAILPGGFMTEPNQRWSKIHPEVIERFRANIPLGDFGQPEDLGPLAVYLASDASRYMTGAALVIDGGYTLW